MHKPTMYYLLVDEASLECSVTLSTDSTCTGVPL